MRPARLEIHNFRGWRSGAISFEAPLSVVVGANRAGKSSTLNALEWCLFGDEVEKRSSGIAERSDWQAAQVASEAIEVTATFAHDGGDVRVTRRRAGPRSGDELAVDEGGRRHAGDAARAWLLRAGFPDWTTWRRAFCQHQELSRARLVETSDRSSILAALLGLDAYDALDAKLRELRPAAVIKQLDEAQDRLETLVLQRLRRPEEELAELEARLASRGIDRASVGVQLALDVAAGMLARARALDEGLRLESALPRCERESDLDAVESWAGGFANVARGESRSAERASEISRRRGELLAAVGAFEPAAARARISRTALDGHLRERGDVAALRASIATSEETERAAEAAVRAQSALLALLGDARDVLRAAADPERCPVCDSRTRDLSARLDAALASGRSASGVERSDELRRARERTIALREGLRAVENAARDESEAQKTLELSKQKLLALVPEARLAAHGQDALRAARDEIDALAAESSRLQAASAERERELQAHARDLDLLRELAKWRAASRRAAHRTTLDGSPAYQRLERAIDAAAAFAVDLDALAALGREAQEELSARREREVNARLGAYFELVTGDASGANARVRVKRTAKGLSYDLEDARGGRSLATLNQASLNALSLALLFAQAEERAASGAPAWLVLDDPAQSLDPQHQAGLARAIERVAMQCPVIVATPEGPLAEALASSRGAALVRLEPWNGSRGVEVAR